MGVGQFLTGHLPHRQHEPEARHSRVIHPGDEAEWVSVIHRNGSISEVQISADNDDVNIGVGMAQGKELHLSHPWF